MSSETSQFRLLQERRFAPFFGAQFLGAFNDNFYKNALVILLTFHAAAMTTLGPGTLVNLCAGLFILPFFLFSATAGQIADKYDKAAIIRWVKLVEIGIMVLGAAGLLRQNLVLLLAALFLMGVHSTVFGPVKYSILPQHLKEEELVGGNALVETGTFLAILLGTILGGVLIALESGREVVSATVIAIAMAGYATSRFVPAAPPAAPGLKINWNVVTETWNNFKFTRSNRTVFLSVLGISWFWFYGATFLAQFPAYSKDVLGGNEQVATLLLTIFSVGAGTGALLCERLSGHKVEIGLVPFGSIGLTLFALDLYFASPTGTPATAGVAEFLSRPGSWRIVFDLAMIGVFGSFYIVPLYALIQTRAEKSHQSRIIAGNNLLNALFMVASAGMAIALLAAGLTIPQLFLVIAVLNAAVAAYIYTLVPEFLMRFLVWLLVHTAYRVDKSGLENIPEEGPAVIVCNHVSHVDALIIAAACRRPIRFVADHVLFRVPVLGFVLRTARAIPIAAARDDPALLERAYDEIARTLEAGGLVGMFPEGRVSEDGEISSFRRGIQRIIERTPVPVVAMALRGLWGSVFSRGEGSTLIRRLCKAVSSRVALVVSAPVAPQAATPEALQSRVSALRGDFR